MGITQRAAGPLMAKHDEDIDPSSADYPNRVHSTHLHYPAEPVSSARNVDLNPEHSAIEQSNQYVDCAIATIRNCQSQELFEKALDAMVVVNDDGQYIDANPAACELFGLRKDELIGCSVADFAEPGLDIAEAWQTFLSKGAVRGEFCLVRSDGTVRDTEFAATANFLPHQHLSILRDITARKQAEREKQALERQCDTFFELSIDLLAIANLDGYFLHLNPAWQEVLGFSLDELKSRPFIDFVHPDDRKATLQAIERTKSGKTIQGLENRYRTREGSYRWLSWRSKPLLADGLIYANAHDVTDQKEAEQTVKQQVQQEYAYNQVVQAIRSSLDLNTIFSVSTAEIACLLDGEVAIVQYVPEQHCWIHRVVYEQGKEFFEKENLEIPDKGNPFADQLKNHQIVRVDDTQTINDPINQELAESSPGAWLLMPISIDGVVWGSLSLGRSHPNRAPWNDDEISLAQRVADQLAIAIHQSILYQQVQDLNTDLEAQIQERTAQLRASLAYEALLKRITDKVRDSLDESQILQAAVEELAIGMDIDCCDTGIYDAAKATSTIVCEFTKGWKPAAGQSFSIQTPLKQAVYDQLLARRECQFCDISGDCIRTVPYAPTILAVPIFDDQDILGDLWLFKHSDKVFNFQEIRLVQQVANQCAIALRQARLYQAAQRQVIELERVNQMKDDFLSTVSHELRSPMANIKMASEMLELYLQRLPETHTLPSNIERYVQILKKECQRETHLINDLLDLARLESRDITLNVSSLQLDIWILALAKTFQERAQKQRQQFQLQIPELVIETELTYLERIITELLHNACKYTPAGEIIQMSAQQNGSRVILSVCNSGVEIPVEEGDRIFDKFYRISNNDPWKQGGTGLGLALIKKLVQQLQGTIQLHSARRQTCFVITLPMRY